MGIVVDAGQIAAEAASITDTITAAKEKINTLIEAIGAFIADGGLSGQAYTGAKGYFAGYLPSLNALKAQMDSLLSAKSSMLSALGSCPHLGYADEDECNEEIRSLTIQRSNFQRIKANAYTIEIIGGIATPVINYGLINYCDAQIYLINNRIKELEDTIKELITFNACSSFASVDASCDELKKAISCILSGDAPYLPGTNGAYISKYQAMVTGNKVLREIPYVVNPIIYDGSGTYGCGEITFNGAVYSIYIPYPGADFKDGWDTIKIENALKFSKPTVDWGKAISEILAGDLPDVKGKNIYAGNKIVSDGTGTTPGGAAFVVVSAVADGAKKVADNTTRYNCDVFLQERGEERRVVIVGTSTQARQQYTSVANDIPIQSGLYNSAMGSVAAEKLYAEIYGEDYSKMDYLFTSFDTSVSVDSKHKEDNGGEAYLWLDKNNKLMGTPIIYDNDKVFVGPVNVLGIFKKDNILEAPVNFAPFETPQYQRAFDAINAK